MYIFRRLIAALLIATLPAYAWAMLGVPQTCPVQGTPVAATSAAGHTCCDIAAAGDEAPQSGQGMPCKAGQQCQGGSLFHLPNARAASPCVGPVLIAAVAETPIHSRDSTNIWRPPRAP